MDTMPKQKTTGRRSRPTIKSLQEQVCKLEECLAVQRSITTEIAGDYRTEYELRLKLQEEELDAFEKWRACWELCCNWAADPVGYQSWNGAIETLCKYLDANLPGEEFSEFDESAKELTEKIRKKFLSV